MTLRIRRVITGHDPQLKAVVVSDEMLSATASRPGQEACPVWAAERVPTDNLDPAAATLRPAGSTLANGAVFRVVRYAAGTSGRMHRTRSLDYGVVLSGSIVLQLDDDAEVALGAGDVLVQRGTIHNWINRGAEPCTIAFILIDALPLPLDAAGAHEPVRIP